MTSNTELLRDRRGNVIPQILNVDGTYTALANGDTRGIDFRQHLLLRDGFGSPLPEQYFDVNLMQFVAGSITGESSGFAINLKGELDEEEQLPESANKNDAYLIGQDIHVWNGEQWLNTGPIVRGPQGLTGEKGTDGKDAYNLAVANGYSGTLTEWLNSLKGEPGPPGEIPTQIPAENIVQTSLLQFLKADEKVQILSNANNLMSHAERLAALENLVVNMVTTDRFASMNEFDVPDYLGNKIDGTTIFSNANKLTAISLFGLVSTIMELNQLQGVRENVQLQIDNMAKLHDVRDIVDTELELSVDVPVDEITVLVREDSTQDGASTYYRSDGTSWVYVGKIDSGFARDFTVDPIDLGTEVKNVLAKAKYEKQNASETAIEDAAGNFQSDNVEGALAEVFQLANNIKERFRNVIGAPLNSIDTVTSMINKIDAMKAIFSEALRNHGLITYPYEPLSDMINKVPYIQRTDISASIKKTERFNVVAPQQIMIDLIENIAETDIVASVIEFTPGAINVAHYDNDFKGGIGYTSEDIDFTDGIKIQTDYEYPLNATGESDGYTILSTHIDRKPLNLIVNGYQIPATKENIIPIMTSNTTPSGRAFSSGLYSNAYTNWYAFNSNLAQSWTSNIVAFPHHIGYQFPKKKLITGYSVTIRAFDQNDIPVAPKNWQFQISDNGIDYTTVDTRVNVTWSAKGQEREFTLDKPVSAVYWRIWITANNGYNNVSSVGRIKVYGSDYSPLKTIFKNRNTGAHYAIDVVTKTLKRLLDGSAQTILNEGLVANTTVDFDTIPNFFTEVGETFDVVSCSEVLSTQSNIVKTTVEHLERKIATSEDILLDGVERVRNIMAAQSMGDVLHAISFDSGATWRALKNGVWEYVTNAHEGMTSAVLNSLSDADLNAIRNGSNKMRFSHSFAADGTFKRLTVYVDMQGKQGLAATTSFGISYRPRQIILDFKKDGIYYVNYVDGA